jgi:Anti-sigma-K factor rskA, C-terminal
VQDTPEFDRRLTELQSQINRLSLSLHLWQERQDRLLEQRLTDWNAVEARAQQEASARMRDLQHTIEHEWTELRQVHEEPGRQLRDLETSLGQKLTELTEQVQTAVIELRSMAGHRPLSLQAAAPTWPLDDVVRLHNQLRDTGESNGHGEQGLATRPPLLLPEIPGGVSERLDSLERAVTDGQTESREAAERNHNVSRGWRAAIIILAVGVGAAGVLVNRLQRQVTAATARVSQAEQQTQAVTKSASEQIAAAREEATRQIAEARDAAIRAQTISDVLAAPDLVRYNLVGGDEAASFSAQALLSRSRGLVFSGSRLPAPPPESTYQIWLLSNGGPVSVGTFVPDASGRYSMATADVPRVPPPVAGVSVTVERAGGRERPTGRTILARAQPPPPLTLP